MQNIVRCAIALLLLTFNGEFCAQAAEASNRNPHFARLDTNKDGFLSYAEARMDKAAAQQFALYDENRDGKLSEDEYLKLKATRARRSAGVYISDSAITSKVKLAALRAKDLKSAEIHVDTVAAVVKLSGEVDTLEQSEHAAKLAGRAKGVKRVENRLKVRERK
ncbi:MAG: BON domain-containing protein [Burkholderiales bacterium]